ncbi:formate dehydrogenase accessory sulfurtransferase FdhD [Rhodocytophaga rosea]|uniref:Sulfur carrier protein FdhD n=1 Tax=Rhodocytophaga rosea TaxID=2704465 RepID=A0A6C0GG25_9BACT|nr:formate dehydrogenase accessory sulfurtransferase FdhD [Rhodocytophaga rosea]QHT67001.1 formate dehydrogenase accessory sulfurtransferase FdhD [Rhodocytophaga rosea]
MAIAAIKYTAGKPQETLESLAREEALQIKINCRAYTITMRTPGQDDKLALGLLFTEGIIHSREDILSVSQIPAPHGDHTLVVEVTIREEVVRGKNLFNRSIASSASCGVCGKTELCDLVSPQQIITTSKKLDICLIPELLQQMHARQSVFEHTGGSHAAALFSIEGKLLSVQEDIGRHNAVDKVIGELFLDNLLSQADILFVSGRVSYEIVAKCAQAGIPFLLAVSAPSSLAVEFCQKKGITLVGFCRENRATVYANEGNILQQANMLQTFNNQPHETSYF